MNRLLKLIYTLFLCVFLINVYASTQETTSQQNKAKNTGVSYLFAQHAKTATYDSKTGKITLHGLSGYTIDFSDRPNRLVKFSTMNDFSKIWHDKKHGFDRDPPNAAIFYYNHDKKRHEVVIAELSKPVFNAKNNTIEYNITAIKSHKKLKDKISSGNAHLAVMLPKSMDNVSIVIDSWWRKVIHHITHTIKKVADKGALTILAGNDEALCGMHMSKQACSNAASINYAITGSVGDLASIGGESCIYAFINFAHSYENTCIYLQKTGANNGELKCTSKLKGSLKTSFNKSAESIADCVAENFLDFFME